VNLKHKIFVASVLMLMGALVARPQGKYPLEQGMQRFVTGWHLRDAGPIGGQNDPGLAGEDSFWSSGLG